MTELEPLGVSKHNTNQKGERGQISKSHVEKYKNVECMKIRLFLRRYQRHGIIFIFF